jgi:hypothetical protein
MRILRRWQVLEATSAAELARLNKEAKPNTRWQPIDGGRPGYQLLACVEVQENPTAPKAQTPQLPTTTKAPSSKSAAKASKGVPPVIQAAYDSVAKAKEKAKPTTKPKPKTTDKAPTKKPRRSPKKKTSSKATRPKK